MLRARVLLLATDGWANTAVAEQIGVAPSTVRAWRKQFTDIGLDRFGMVAPGRGRKPSNFGGAGGRNRGCDDPDDPAQPDPLEL